MTGILQLTETLFQLGLISRQQAPSPAGVDSWETLAQQRAPWASEGIEHPSLTPYQMRQIRRANSPEELRRRLRWNQYLILDRLGHGGMGVVFKAWDLQSRRFVALKRVRAESVELRRRFRREARLLARLDHPTIARCLGVTRVGRTTALVMEFVDGETVTQFVNRLRLNGQLAPWRKAVRLILKALDGLEHIHGRRIIHRDIKPSNLMLDQGGGVKLLDLGLAKFTGDDVELNQSMTIPGQVLGTSDFMPLEQWSDGRNVTSAADLYGLGATLFFLLAGRPPHQAASCYQLLRDLAANKVPSIRDIRPDVPPELDDVIRKMLDKNPRERGTARELKDLLKRLLEMSSGEQPRPAVAMQSTAAPQQVAPCGPEVTSLVREITSEVARGLREVLGLVPRQDSIFRATPCERLVMLGSDLACRFARLIRFWPWRKTFYWLLTCAAATATVFAWAFRGR